jgi:FKBP-type peptidyl-prolyl cis-trans isomerase FkpA
MTRAIALVFAGVIATQTPAFPPPPRGTKPEVKRWEFPKLDAREWKKKESGLEVWDLVVGKGTEATAAHGVTIRYTGWLTDGSVFDTTEKDSRGPATLPLGGLIKGWQEGVPGMKPGGVRRLKIPADLAYGAMGAGAGIPPNATLMFEIEMIESK